MASRDFVAMVSHDFGHLLQSAASGVSRALTCLEDTDTRIPPEATEALERARLNVGAAYTALYAVLREVTELDERSHETPRGLIDTLIGIRRDLQEKVDPPAPDGLGIWLVLAPDALAAATETLVDLLALCTGSRDGLSLGVAVVGDRAEITVSACPSTNQTVAVSDWAVALMLRLIEHGLEAVDGALSESSIEALRPVRYGSRSPAEVTSVTFTIPVRRAGGEWRDDSPYPLG